MNSILRSKSSLLCLSAVVSAALFVTTGCELGSVASTPMAETTAIPAIGGILHGGPNPVVGARVVLYATTNSAYGTGQFLQEATKNYPASGPVTHQDTDASGNFSFAGGVACPTGQFAYIVAYGGNTGGGNSTSNPNSVLVSPVGSCDTLYTTTTGANPTTTYNGGNIWVDELTTVATAYALANFINVSGDSVNGYTVGIGSSATNGGAAPCVVNGYYPACTTTQANGLAHAFTNALALVNNSNGVVNATTPNGAIVPVQELNTLGNIIQACVNSTGGGTAAGAPSSTTTSAGTSHDGTVCGKFFAFTSYTSTGAPAGTLTGAGNTLTALVNLVKRPNGSASTFDSSCDSNSGTGSTTAVSCIFGLAPSNGAYNPSMTVAPPEWTVGISYPKSSFNQTSVTGTFAAPVGGNSAACGNATATNGLLYPVALATDINDNVAILNGDASTVVCANIIAVGSDGTYLGSNAPDNTNGAVVSLATDAWGHAILPVAVGNVTTTMNGVRFYQYNAGGTTAGTDSSVPLVANILSTGGNTSTATTTSAYKSWYSQVDGNNRVYVAARNSFNSWGYLAPTTLSHTGPAYTSNALVNGGTGTTSSLYGITVDDNNNAFTASTSTLDGTGTAGTTFIKSGAGGGTVGTTTATIVQADTSLNVWQIVNNGTTLGTSQTVVLKYPFTSASGTITYGTNSTATTPTYAFPVNSNSALNDGLNAGLKMGEIDGNNVIWFADLFGQLTTAPYSQGFLRGYDTVNNYGTPQLLGCKFSTTSSFTISGWNITASGTTFTLSGTGTAPSVGAILTLSGFPTSTFFNGITVTVTANTAYSATGPVFATITVANTFGQMPSMATEAGVAAGRASSACGSNAGDTSYPSNTPFLLYQTRGTAIDAMGDIWFANGTQGQVSEILSLAAPTWPEYIHNGTSNKP